MPSPTSNGLTLLGLPTEMTQLISSFFVGGDALLQLRRTCKQLEATSHAQFVREFIAHQYCWVLDYKRWKRIEEILNSKLGEHVTKITFTLDVLEDAEPSDSIVRYRGPNGKYLRRNCWEYLFRHVSEFYNCMEALMSSRFRRPDLSTMTRLLLDTRERGIPLHLNFEGWFPSHDDEWVPMHVDTGPRGVRDLLSAAAISQPKVEQLVVSDAACEELDSVLSIHGSELLKLIKSVDTLKFPPGSDGTNVATEWSDKLEKASSKEKRS